MTPTPGPVAQACGCQKYRPRAPEEPPTYRKSNLSGQYVLNRSNISTWRFQNDVSREKQRESGGGAEVVFVCRRRPCRVGVARRNDTLPKKSKKCCSRVNARHETVGIRSEPHVTASGSFPAMWGAPLGTAAQYGSCNTINRAHM